MQQYFEDFKIENVTIALSVAYFGNYEILEFENFH